MYHIYIIDCAQTNVNFPCYFEIKLFISWPSLGISSIIQFPLDATSYSIAIAITSKAVVLLTLKRFNWFTESVVKEKLFVDILSSLSTSHTFSDLRPTNKQYQLQLNQNLEQSINKMARRCVNEVLFREIGGGPIIVCVPDNLKPSLKKTQN